MMKVSLLLQQIKAFLQNWDEWLKQDKVTVTPRYVVNLFIVYELDTLPNYLNPDFTLKECFFGAVKLTKNADQDKYRYSAYGIFFDFCSLLSLLNYDWDKNAIIFGVDISL